MAAALAGFGSDHWAGGYWLCGVCGGLGGGNVSGY